MRSASFVAAAPLVAAAVLSGCAADPPIAQNQTARAAGSDDTSAVDLTLTTRESFAFSPGP